MPRLIDPGIDGQHWAPIDIKDALPDILAKWQPLLHVSANRAFVRRMKTKWGSSNPDQRTVRLNTELARKHPHCLEYVVLHELAHFVSRRHDKQFVLLDERLPTGGHSRRTQCWPTTPGELDLNIDAMRGLDERRCSSIQSQRAPKSTVGVCWAFAG